jgi:hypothetical protein
MQTLIPLVFKDLRVVPAVNSHPDYLLSVLQDRVSQKQVLVVDEYCLLACLLDPS